MLVSGSGEKGGEESGALGHGFVEHKLVRRVRAISDGSKAIQSRNAESAGEVAVRRATGRGFAKGKPHLFGQGFGASKQFGAMFAFQRRAIETTPDLEFHPSFNR